MGYELTGNGRKKCEKYIAELKAKRRLISQIGRAVYMPSG